MNSLRAVRFTLQPRLLLDVRDWYRSRFTSTMIPAQEGEDSVGERTIVRIRDEVRVIARPGSEPDPDWPFAAPMLLVLNEGASGMRSFHGRIAHPGGVRLRTDHYSLTHGTAVEATISARGYQSVRLDNMSIPSADELLPRPDEDVWPPVPVHTVSLRPAQDYSYPPPPRPTVIWGRVVNEDGNPVAGAEVEITPDDADAPQFPELATTDGDGFWEFDALTPGTTGESGVQVRATKDHLTGHVDVMIRHARVNPEPTLQNPAPLIVLTVT